jgi:hypothetical protein
MSEKKEYKLSEAISYNSSVKDFKNICHVYFLLKDEVVVYVGQSSNVSSRIKAHKADKDFDTFKVLECEEHELNATEALLIKAFIPKYNLVGAKGTLTEVDFLKLQDMGFDGLIPIEMTEPIGLPKEPFGYGPVRFTSGPLKGREGYYDNDETIYPDTEDAADFEDYGFNVPHSGRVVAVVYPGEFTKGYLLYPFEWISPMDEEGKDFFGALSVMEKLWPGVLDDVKSVVQKNSVAEA